ncbi:MAG: sigma 54-interacting transcriptional regulator [Syntrophales bacterium]|nr:sigma 54-interacting transcriptional regulator [Syntrophales bacterium]MDY0045147.1 sigma 54-interacting transcriptional regulator [Syntrophales bacterium]
MKAKSEEFQLFTVTKHQELNYYKNLYRNTLREWRKFVAGEDHPDPEVIPEEICQAWLRCRDYGIDPMKMPAKVILTGKKLERLMVRNKEFIDVSRPFVENIYRFLKGSHFNVCLFDKEGYLLDTMGDHDTPNFWDNAGGIVGALWSEKSAGHNVCGTIVELKRPIQIYGSQHYIRDYHGETGSGAPVFSPEGDFLGGITLTGRNFRVNAHTLGMAVAAAYAIENNLKSIKAFTESRHAYSYQHSVISSIKEALTAFDGKGRISLINKHAKDIFSLNSKSVEGKTLRDLLNNKNVEFIRLMESHDSLTDKEVSIFSNDSWNDFTVSLTPIIAADGKLLGKILTINEIRRAKAMLTRILGYRAAFRFDDICGRNPKFLKALDQAKMVARSDSNVLLLGKSGTGKDIIAQSIHNASSRKNGPYVAINCGAIPRDLIANELFGHEEGAFTGSRRGGNQGKFELAEGGTIFLDEITETPLELQTALLRVIEDKSVARIGGKHLRKFDVRIIAATNKDIKEEIRKGNFREDLYYRINVFTIHLVSLRERPDDVRRLSNWFIKKYEKQLGVRIESIDEKIFEAFVSYSWPGNVRELQNVIERMMHFTRSSILSYDLVPVEIINAKPLFDEISEMESPEEREKKIILKMLDMKYRKTKIAEKLNISRATLYRKMKKFNFV